MEYGIWIISFLMFSTGLFLTAKYMEKSYALISFIPIANWYVIVSLAWYGTLLFTAICAFFVFWVIYLPLGFLVVYVIQAYLLYQVWMRTIGKVFPSMLAALLPPIGMLWIWIELKFKWKNENLKNQPQIKVIKCPHCTVRQQIRVSRKKHTCNECNKEFIFDKWVEVKKS